MPADVTFLGSASSVTDLTTYTFSSQNFGTPDGTATRHIVVAIGSRANAARSISSVTIGGVAATAVITANDTVGGADIAAIYIAAVPTGRTGDVVVVFSAAMLRCAITIYRVTNIDSITASDTGSDIVDASNVFSDTINIPANGIGIAACWHNTSAGNATATWAGLAEDVEVAPESATNSLSSACDNFVAAQTGLTVSMTSGGTVGDGGLAIAAWAPAATAVSPAQLVDSGALVG